MKILQHERFLLVLFSCAIVKVQCKSESVRTPTLSTLTFPQSFSAAADSIRHCHDGRYRHLHRLAWISSSPTASRRTRILSALTTSPAGVTSTGSSYSASCRSAPWTTAAFGRSKLVVQQSTKTAHDIDDKDELAFPPSFSSSIPTVNTKAKAAKKVKKQTSTPRFAQTTLTPMRSSSGGSSSDINAQANKKGPFSSSYGRTNTARNGVASSARPQNLVSNENSRSRSQNNSNSKANGGNKVQKENSIEELEARLTNRFGTDLSQWTAKDGEYDDDDDGGDYERESGEVISAPKVYDPWEATTTTTTASSSTPSPRTDEQVVTAAQKRQWGETEVENDRDGSSGSSRDGGKNNKDLSSRAVKTAAAEVAPVVSKSPLSAFGRITPTSAATSTVATSSAAKTSTVTTPQPRMNLRHLIADTPAGGVGTFQKPLDERGRYDSATTPKIAADDTSTRSMAASSKANAVPSPYKDVPIEATTGEASQRRPVYLTTLEAERLANITAREQKRAAQMSDDDDGEMTNDSWSEINSFDTVAYPDRDTSSMSWAEALNDTSSGKSSSPSLTQTLFRNLDRMGCASPLATQRDASRWIRPGAVDVVIGTSTGSGKTLAVLVPVLHRLFSTLDKEAALKQESLEIDDHGDAESPAVVSTSPPRSGGNMPLQVLVMAPGRELASQIASVARDLIQDTNWTVVLAVGGTTYTRNVQTIRQRHPQILIGTPGRLAELIVGGNNDGGAGSGASKRGSGGPVHISELNAVVLDEFDALIGESSHADPTLAVMDYIKRKTAARGNRPRNDVLQDVAPVTSTTVTMAAPLQTILCSATASDMLVYPKKRLQLEQSLHLRPGYALSMAEEDTVVSPSSRASSTSAITTRMSRTIIHGVVHVPHQRMALDMLRRILHTEPVPQQILVFVSDARRVNIVVDKLYNMNIIAAPLHGGMGSVKTDRAEVSKALRDGTVGLVVATEMAARGLDAPYLTHVVNLDLPTDASHYAHRAGRCGRGRRPGVVINLTTSPQERSVPTKLANALGIAMYTIQVKSAKLNIVDPESLDWSDLL